MARAAHAHGLTELFLISYFALLYAKYYITRSFLANNNMDTSNLYCSCFSFVSMTAFGLFIYLIARARKDSKRLFTMLEELNETIFQLKDAMDFSFRELQLNMDNVLKSLKILHTKTNETTAK